MRHYLTAIFIAATLSITASAQSFTLTLTSDDFVVTPAFNDVGVFSIVIEIDAPLEPGVFDDPPIVNVNYQVSGDLTVTTPSGFPAFALTRDISGTEFYDQGSSLSFEIAPTAVLSDGLQLAELVGADTVFTFNGREIDNGRFHPALLVLDSDGSGSIRNSNNVITLNPLREVDFGEEYITDLIFDPGNTTIVAAPAGVPPITLGSGGGSISAIFLLAIGLLLMALRVSPARRLGKRRPFR